MELHVQTDMIASGDEAKIGKTQSIRVTCALHCIVHIGLWMCVCECRMFKKRKSGYGMHFRFTIGQKYHDAMQLKLEWHKPWTMDKYSKFCQLFWSPGGQIKNSCSEYM